MGKRAMSDRDANSKRKGEGGGTGYAELQKIKTLFDFYTSSASAKGGGQQERHWVGAGENPPDVVFSVHRFTTLKEGQQKKPRSK